MQLQELTLREDQILEVLLIGFIIKICNTQSSSGARPPSNGYVIQESNSTIGATNAEIQTYFGSGSISNVDEQRNFRFIADATWA